MCAIIFVLVVLVMLVAACVGDPAQTLSSSGAGTGAGAGTPTSTGVGPGTGPGTGPATGPSTGPGGPNGRAFFDENVSPILNNGTAGALCASCHSSEFPDTTAGPDFLGTATTTYYDSLVANVVYVNATPASSRLLTRGQHLGPAFTAPQAALVTEWLEIEALRFAPMGTGGAGGGGVPPTGLTGAELLQEFSDCMTLNDWITTGMPDVALNGTLTQGACYSCHQSGIGENFMTDPANEASLNDGFALERNMPFLQNLVTFAVDPVTGQATSVVQSYRWQDHGDEPGTHPKYLMAVQNVAAIDNWFTVVSAKLVNGECTLP
jgi:hypothetical protein